MKRSNPQSLEDMNYADYCDALVDERYMRRASAELARRARIAAEPGSESNALLLREQPYAPGESANIQ